MNQPFKDDGLPSFGSPLEDALAWFTRLRSPEAGASDRAAFIDWLSADPSHKEAYNKVKRLWQSPALSDALLRMDEPLPILQKRRYFQAWAMAASLLIFTAWGLFAFGFMDRWRSDYSTIAGEQSRVILADGSSVTLNTDSALALDFSENKRGVRLLRGEAFFEVQSDRSRPFTVSTDKGQVQVIGTRFNVQVGNSTSVDVESGIVACANQRGEEVRLSIGQHADISTQGVSSPVPVDVNRAFAWLNKRLIFQDQPLYAVLEELDRYHKGRIFLSNEKLAQIQVSGNYKLDDTAAILQSLADIVGAQAISITPYVTVLR